MESNHRCPGEPGLQPGTTNRQSSSTQDRHMIGDTIRQISGTGTVEACSGEGSNLGASGFNRLLYQLSYLSVHPVGFEPTAY